MMTWLWNLMSKLGIRSNKTQAKVKAAATVAATTMTAVEESPSLKVPGVGCTCSYPTIMERGCQCAAPSSFDQSEMSVIVIPEIETGLLTVIEKLLDISRKQNGDETCTVSAETLQGFITDALDAAELLQKKLSEADFTSSVPADVDLTPAEYSDCVVNDLRIIPRCVWYLQELRTLLAESPDSPGVISACTFFYSDAAGVLLDMQQMYELPKPWIVLSCEEVTATPEAAIAITAIWRKRTEASDTLQELTDIWDGLRILTRTNVVDDEAACNKLEDLMLTLSRKMNCLTSAAITKLTGDSDEEEPKPKEPAGCY